MINRDSPVLPNPRMVQDETTARRTGYSFIIGIDEAGRGPLAGPVIAAAVLLRKKKFSCPVRDSKKLTAIQRERAFHEIVEQAYVGVGMINETVIDQVNILRATFFAMRNAAVQLIGRMPAAVRVRASFQQKVCLLIDGPQFHSDLPYAHQTIIRGDEKVLSIMCASIVAKVIRDRMLTIYDRIFPEYGFVRHKGYATREHRLALRRLGPSEIHRRSFRIKK